MDYEVAQQPDAWVNADELEENQREESPYSEFDILAAPNDWNSLTLVNYMERGAIRIPRFQRNFVWDTRKASRLIESLLVGLPVPQIFLYEQSRNRFLVIDGQQRLLSIYFFYKGRFPKAGVRGTLGELLKSDEGLNASALANDDIFQSFKLSLPTPEGTPPNRFHGLKYDQLGEFQSSLDLRTIRNVVVKQVTPAGHESMFEIFNRLNTGGVNLNPQEIRTSLYRSHLIDLALELNREQPWRELIGSQSLDGRMADVECLIRSLALANRRPYASPMTGFVNAFCISAQSWEDTDSEGAIARLEAIIGSCRKAGPAAFRRQGRFSPALFEAVVAACWDSPTLSAISEPNITALAQDEEFVKSLQEGSTKTSNVAARLSAARRYVAPNG